MNIKYKYPGNKGISNVDSVELMEELSAYALNVIFDLLDQQAKILFNLHVEVDNEITEADDILEQAVLKFINAKVIKEKMLEANALKIAAARSEEVKAEEAKMNEQCQCIYSNIKKQRVDYPGIDLITIRDGYVISINYDSVHLYKSIEDLEQTSLDSMEIPQSNEQIRKARDCEACGGMSGCSDCGEINTQKSKSNLRKENLALLVLGLAGKEKFTSEEMLDTGFMKDKISIWTDLELI